MKHTPGPWKVFGKSSHGCHVEALADVAWCGTNSYHHINGDSQVIDANEAYANACLIAAAPELLEALRVLLEAVEGKRVTQGDCNQARAAIAKAEAV